MLPFSIPYRLQDLVTPTLEPGSQSFVDLNFTTDGALMPESSRIWQFSLTPVKVRGPLHWWESMPDSIRLPLNHHPLTS